MQHFSFLILKLDQTTSTKEKTRLLAEYLKLAPEKDALWSIALFSHRRPRRTITTTLLREWAAQAAGIPNWLFEESYHVVGDLAETIALVAPPPSTRHSQSLTHWINYIREMGSLDESLKKKQVLEAWKGLQQREKFIFNKLITGGFRVGISQKLLVRALSIAFDLDEPAIAHRLMGDWDPDQVTLEDLLFAENRQDDLSRPYPFHLAYPLESEPENLDPISDWLAEYKWDGIRGQLIIREATAFLWSRGEELITGKFPEFQMLNGKLPDGTVLDGEILGFRNGQPLSFNELQKRIGRKNTSRKLLEQVPVVFMAFDLLEWEGNDIRPYPLRERRNFLERLLSSSTIPETLKLSEKVEGSSWEDFRQARAKARAFNGEGLMLKKLDSPYTVGRKKGLWWKWKVAPLTIDAVMIYAQRGHGRRANLFTDFTFAVWDGPSLVPFAKAYSGLTDREFREITHWVRNNTLSRFGPVRAVKPQHVFEIAFEGIRKSGRHKSGVAIRFPRMLRWRKDKPVEQANTLRDLHHLLEKFG